MLYIAMQRFYLLFLPFIYIHTEIVYFGEILANLLSVFQLRIDLQHFVQNFMNKTNMMMI